MADDSPLSSLVPSLTKYPVLLPQLYFVCCVLSIHLIHLTTIASNHLYFPPYPNIHTYIHTLYSLLFLSLHRSTNPLCFKFTIFLHYLLHLIVTLPIFSFSFDIVFICSSGRGSSKSSGSLFQSRRTAEKNASRGQ